MSDTPINPSSLVANGALVSAANPLPVTSVAAGTPATALEINPRTFVVDGALVSVSNPIPLTIV